MTRERSGTIIHGPRIRISVPELILVFQATMGEFQQDKTPSTIGEWQTGNKLRTGLQFENAGG